MENVSHEVKNYTHYFLPNGEYKYFDNLSPILRKKTTIFFSKSLTKIEDDADNKKYLEVLKDIVFFGTSFNSAEFDLPTKCMIDISIKYVDCLNQYCKKNNSTILKSNQDSVLATINQLTGILFTNDKLHREIDSTWMLFLQNLHLHIFKLIQKEDYIIFSFQNSKHEWGWIELQVKSYANCLFDFLENILTVNSHDLIKPMCFEESERIYEYVGSIIKNLRKIFGIDNRQNLKISETFILYLKSKYYKLIEISELFKVSQKQKQVSISNDSSTFSENQDISTEKPLPIDENRIETLAYNDFIDLVIGEDRKSKEINFAELIKKMPNGLIKISNEKYQWDFNYFIDTYKTVPKKLQNYTYVFYGICLNKGYISIDELPLSESKLVEQIKSRICITFNLDSKVPLSSRKFKAHEYVQLQKKKHYFVPFSKL